MEHCKKFSGDGPRYINRGYTVVGTLTGQQAQGYRWPYGPCMHIAPFNFPLEIPALQMIGALIMGNKILVKPDSKVAIVSEQFVRLLIACGLPTTDVDLLHTDGAHTEKFVTMTPEIRLLQFTGSNLVAEKLVAITKGKAKIENAGFNWKTFGPGALASPTLDWIAYQADQDCYAAGGQKCSAQRILFMHEDYNATNYLDLIKKHAESRKLEDLTIVPTLTWSNKKIKAHIDALLKIPGAKLLFGGEPVKNTTIPDVYGCYKPTAIVSLKKN
jgi:1-pyrroline-5-carboxylate dehydrogenase